MGLSDYDSLVQKYASIYGIDWLLAKAVEYVESTGNPAAVSPKGALGLFQLLPSTMTEQLGAMPKNPFDPETNIKAGIGYLARMISMFSGDIRLGLAAYNAGPGNVQKYNGIPPFPETQGFVSSVLSTYQSFGGNVGAGGTGGSGGGVTGIIGNVFSSLRNAAATVPIDANTISILIITAGMIFSLWIKRKQSYRRIEE